MKNAQTTVVCIAAFIASCGWSVESARETLAQKTCDYFARCEHIGPGKTYESRDTCATKQRANWIDLLPTEKCGNHINSTNFDICARSIDNTQCGNTLDVLSTWSKCTASSVCE